MGCGGSLSIIIVVASVENTRTNQTIGTPNNTEATTEAATTETKQNKNHTPNDVDANTKRKYYNL